MFNYPSIVCHHDFSKCDLSTDTLPKNVSFVRPHIETAWGEFSAVEAIIKAIKLMYESVNPPDWFILLKISQFVWNIHY
ncbi:Core-2/I-Branching enzyme [Planktothrix tepida]|uniref:Core-2/I-Branching enzyme n=2 Tax=Planktothrix TaxID=54304 RepID=A0A1J1LQD8_9CYAN